MLRLARYVIASSTRGMSPSRSAGANHHPRRNAVVHQSQQMLRLERWWMVGMLMHGHVQIAAQDADIFFFLTETPGGVRRCGGSRSWEQLRNARPYRCFRTAQLADTDRTASGSQGSGVRSGGSARPRTIIRRTCRNDDPSLNSSLAATTTRYLCPWMLSGALKRFRLSALGPHRCFFFWRTGQQRRMVLFLVLLPVLSILGILDGRSAQSEHLDSVQTQQMHRPLSHGNPRNR